MRTQIGLIGDTMNWARIVMNHMMMNYNTDEFPEYENSRKLCRCKNNNNEEITGHIFDNLSGMFDKVYVPADISNADLWDLRHRHMNDINEIYFVDDHFRINKIDWAQITIDDKDKI